MICFDIWILRLEYIQILLCISIGFKIYHLRIHIIHLYIWNLRNTLLDCMFLSFIINCRGMLSLIWLCKNLIVAHFYFSRFIPSFLLVNSKIIVNLVCFSLLVSVCLINTCKVIHILFRWCLGRNWAQVFHLCLLLWLQFRVILFSAWNVKYDFIFVVHCKL